MLHVAFEQIWHCCHGWLFIKIVKPCHLILFQIKTYKKDYDKKSEKTTLQSFTHWQNLIAVISLISHLYSYEKSCHVAMVDHFIWIIKSNTWVFAAKLDLKEASQSYQRSMVCLVAWGTGGYLCRFIFVNSWMNLKIYIWKLKACYETTIF